MMDLDSFDAHWHLDWAWWSFILRIRPYYKLLKCLCPRTEAVSIGGLRKSWKVNGCTFAMFRLSTKYSHNAIKFSNSRSSEI